MKAIPSQNSIVHFNADCYTAINQHLKTTSYSTLFIIVDTNTFEYCYPNFMSKMECDIPTEIIQIEAGEKYKNLETCAGVWNALSELNADRKCLIINIGGGVVTDLGGFIASTFKRGVNYINVPTSLLAMVDASVGGKTGVDLGSLKNQIGVINSAQMVLIDTDFLNTLPANEMRSGLAEILKHGLIADAIYWQKVSHLKQLTAHDLDGIIYESVIIKNNIVTQDPLENGLRKSLNYGHTLGHAIESYFLENDTKKTLLHGEAVAIGMVLACFLSTKLTHFNRNECDTIKNIILNLFDKISFSITEITEIIELLKFDKKNSFGNINFVLLEAIGTPKIDCIVPNTLILEAFEYYSA